MGVYQGDGSQINKFICKSNEKLYIYGPCSFDIATSSNLIATNFCISSNKNGKERQQVVGNGSGRCEKVQERYRSLYSSGLSIYRMTRPHWPLHHCADSGVGLSGFPIQVAPARPKIYIKILCIYITQAFFSFSLLTIL
jgi:hypothetical protein